MPDAVLTPESIVAEIGDDLVAAINQGVPRIFRGLVGRFGGKVAAWAIGLLVLRTFATVYPVLLVLEPIAVNLFLPEIAKWFTAAKTLYAAKVGTVQGVDLTAIAHVPTMIHTVMRPGANASQFQSHPPLRIHDPERN